MLCSVPSAQSLHAYTPLCNSLDRTLYDVTFARRFWRDKQVIVCEQTKLRSFVLVDYFTRLSRLDSLACVQRESKKCICHSEQDPGFSRIRCCTVVRRR